MLVYVLGDIHGNHKAVDHILSEQTKISGTPDAIILVGDVGGNFLRKDTLLTSSRFVKYKKSLLRVLRTIEKYQKRIFWVSGNHDSPLSLLHTEEDLHPYLVNHLEERVTTTKEGITLFGLGGSPNQKSPYSFEDNEQLQEHIKDGVERASIIVSHTPPRGYGDRSNPIGEHIGFVGLRNCLDEVKEDKVVLCGHVHEAQGFYSFTNNQGSEIIVVNCGAYAPPCPKNVITVMQLTPEQGWDFEAFLHELPEESNEDETRDSVDD